VAIAFDAIQPPIIPAAKQSVEDRCGPEDGAPLRPQHVHGDDHAEADDRVGAEGQFRLRKHGSSCAETSNVRNGWKADIQSSRDSQAINQVWTRFLSIQAVKPAACSYVNPASSGCFRPKTNEPSALTRHATASGSTPQATIALTASASVVRLRGSIRRKKLNDIGVRCPNT